MTAINKDYVSLIERFLLTCDLAMEAAKTKEDEEAISMTRLYLLKTLIM